MVCLRARKEGPVSRAARSVGPRVLLICVPLATKLRGFASRKREPTNDGRGERLLQRGKAPRQTIHRKGDLLTRQVPHESISSERPRNPVSRESGFPYLHGSFMAKDPKTRASEGFYGENPRRKTSTSIQLRRSIHPTYPWVKGISSENRTNLDPDFRATKRSALLHTGIGEKWGLSGVFRAVCFLCSR